MTTVSQKTNENYYNTKLPYPRREKKPTVGAGASAADMRAAADALDVWEAGEADFDAKKKAYQEDVSRLEAEFRADLAEENGLVDLPDLAEKVYALAYDKGHSYGFSEVAIYYDSFAELALAGYAAGRASK